MDNKVKKASIFVNGLTYVEESYVKQLILAVLWAGGVYAALGPWIAAFWFSQALLVISVPQFQSFKPIFQNHPNSVRALLLGIVTACIWGVAPFMVWQAGPGDYDTLAVVMLGIGFLQVINQYRNTPRPALLVAAPYIMLIAWFLYESRMSPSFIAATLGAAAFLATMAGFLYTGHKSKLALVAYKIEQDDLLAELEEKSIEAEKANQAKSFFLANMSHELRTPLNGILGLSEVLLMEELNDGQRRKIGLIQESGQSLLSLLNDILDISKIEAEGVKIENVTIDLDEFLRSSYAFWKPLAAKRKIALSFQKQKNMPSHLIGDPARLRQCLNNLVNNALKFTPQNGEVKVTATGKPNDGHFELKLCVQDTGIGISTENLEKLFKPFSQAESGTSRQFGGTGLGLAISKKLCRLMGGDITVESALGEGSSFTISITADIASIQPLTLVENTDDAYVPPAAIGKSCLIVEDNKINLEVLVLMLEPYGLHITTAKNGKEALRALEAAHYDFVLMDIQMPVLGGIETTIAIRASGKAYADIPIIAMTANAMQDNRDKCMAAGMNGYMTKPLNKSEIAHAIEGLYLDAPMQPGAAIA